MFFRSRPVQSVISLLCVVAAATASGGCSGGSQATAAHGATTTSSSHVSASSASSAGAARMLFAERQATFDSATAVEHGCPTVIDIRFADSGPVYEENVDQDSAEQKQPQLTWSPPCAGMTQQITYDDGHTSGTAKSATASTEADCVSAVRRSANDGSIAKAIAVSALNQGDRYCAYDSVAGRVLLLKVASLATSGATRITWAATEWSTAASTTSIESGVQLYANQTVTLNDTQAKSTSTGCAAPAADYQSAYAEPQVLIDSSASGDLVYFPSCLGGDAKVRFGDGAHTAAVTGSPDAKSCEDAAAGATSTDLDVPISDLRPGNEYCQYSDETTPGQLALVKVLSVSAAPVAVTVSVTLWNGV